MNIRFLLTLSILIFFISQANGQSKTESIHIVVALCDNIHQGIAPVPAKLGNGKNTKDNLYWGAYYGVKSCFTRNSSWKLVKTDTRPESNIIERIVFKHVSKDTYLVADAYDGEQINQAIDDYLMFCAGTLHKTVVIKGKEIEYGAESELVAYVGHNGLIEYTPASYPQGTNNFTKLAITLGCYSKKYFEEPIRQSGAYPLIWTTGSMAPEAYILEAAIKGWLNKERFEQIQDRAAKAYSKYQKISYANARGLLIGGW